MPGPVLTDGLFPQIDRGVSMLSRCLTMLFRLSLTLSDTRVCYRSNSPWPSCIPLRPLVVYLYRTVPLNYDVEYNINHTQARDGSV